MHGRVVTLAGARRAQTALQISLSSSSHHGRLSSTMSQRFTHPPMRTFASSSPTAQPCRHRFADIEELHDGNQSYMLDMHSANPGLLSALALRGQQPPFLLFDCSDSRVAESAIFRAAPGRLFTSGNIANRFDETETGSQAVLSYAVQTLRVKHVVVMGHYGCGGVAASMLPLPERARAGNVVKKPGDLTRPADVAVQGWIQPIREIYETSDRPEIVAHRERCKVTPMAGLPDLHDPAFRALVEENVKSNVQKIAESAVMQDHYAYVLATNGPGPTSPPSTFAPSSLVPPAAPPQPAPTTSTAATNANDTRPGSATEIFVHGWVYDVETGRVCDLGVTVGPPGREVPGSPFPRVGEE